jgi:hypothetical protein
MFFSNRTIILIQKARAIVATHDAHPQYIATPNFIIFTVAEIGLSIFFHRTSKKIGVATATPMLADATPLYLENVFTLLYNIK